MMLLLLISFVFEVNFVVDVVFVIAVVVKWMIKSYALQEKNSRVG